MYTCGSLSAQAGIEPAPSILPFSMDVLRRLNYCADHFGNNNNAQSCIYRNVWQNFKWGNITINVILYIPVSRG